MPVYTKRMLGERVDNGVVPMNTPFPRPTRETAVGVLEDGPYDVIHVENLVRGTAIVRLTGTGTADVLIECANGDPYPGGNWVEIDRLDGVAVATPANTYSLEFDLGYRFLRFTMAEAGATTLVEIEFQGMSR